MKLLMDAGRLMEIFWICLAVCAPLHLTQAKDSVQLLFTNATNYGLVQLYNSTWMSVCPQVFSDVEARVTCRELGFAAGIALPAFSREVNFYVWTPKNVHEISCKGNERRLVDCKHEPTEYSCPLPSRQAAVLCGSSGQFNLDGSIRIAGNGSSGRLEVSYGNVWGSVCASDFSDREANVACRQLGFEGGYSYGRSSMSPGPVWMWHTTCRGDERVLLDCSFDSGATSANLECGSYSFTHDRQDAHVLCYKDTGQVKYRLADGGQHYGRVEVSFEGEWGTVCDNGWSWKDAFVVCNSLGFKGGEAILDSYYGRGTGSVWMGSVDCAVSGAPPAGLIQCQNGGWKSYDEKYCGGHSHDAGVRCDDIEGGLGFQSGDGTYGPIHYVDKMRFIDICADGWTQKSSEVVCRELGLKVGHAMKGDGWDRAWTRNPTMTNISCLGGEKNIKDCPHVIGRCRSQEGVWLRCMNDSAVSEDLTTMQVKLVGAADPYASFNGRLLATWAGIPGTMCASDWSEAEANVTCSQLGYRGGLPYNFNQNQDPTGLHVFPRRKCKGVEDNLLECQQGEPRCSETIKNAAVICYNDTGLEMRLQDGVDDLSGRVEIRFDGGDWGTICSDVDQPQFAQETARVICRHLGFYDGESFPGGQYDKKPHEFGETNKTVYLSGLRCSGDEASIFDCPNPGWRTLIPEKCVLNSKDVRCFTYGSSIRVRLVNGGDMSGTLQVSRGNTGQWGYVCHDSKTSTNNNVPTVVCRQLGYIWGEFLESTSRLNDTADILSEVSCKGDEPAIAHCHHSIFGQTSGCSHFAAIKCYKESVTFMADKGKNYGQVLMMTKERHLAPVCDDNWNHQGAQIACRHFGYDNGYAFFMYPSIYTSTMASRYGYVTYVNCHKTFDNLTECDHRVVKYKSGCPEQYGSVFCTRQQSELKITDVKVWKGSPHGILFVRSNNIWGQVCGDKFTNKTAQTICWQIGFETGYALPPSYRDSSGPMWILSLECHGDEEKIQNCRINHKKTRCTGTKNDPKARIECTGKNITKPKKNQSKLVKQVVGGVSGQSRSRALSVLHIMTLTFAGFRLIVW